MGLPGLPELIIVFAVVVLLFGAQKIPRLFGAFGEGIKNFKKGIKSEDDHGDLSNLQESTNTVKGKVDK